MRVLSAVTFHLRGVAALFFITLAWFFRVAADFIAPDEFHEDDNDEGSDDSSPA